MKTLRDLNKPPQIEGQVESIIVRGSPREKARAVTSTDASTEQVRVGMAWAFDKYVTDRGLHAVQDVARTERRGLWADREPVAPWEWRKAR